MKMVMALALLLAGFAAGWLAQQRLGSRYTLHAATVEEEIGTTLEEHKRIFRLDTHSGRVWRYDSMSGQVFWTDVAEGLNLQLLKAQSEVMTNK